jgi:BlaI family transcriptional regulator, penicillinase repressor
MAARSGFRNEPTGRSGCLYGIGSPLPAIFSLHGQHSTLNVDRPKTHGITEHQIEIMNVVWRLREATVRDVYEALRAQRPIAYTTVMTTMKTMEAKGHLAKRTDGRACVYKAVEPRNKTLRRVVSDFIDRVFNGSAEPLLMHLVEERQLSQKDLDKISKMIKPKE